MDNLLTAHTWLALSCDISERFSAQGRKVLSSSGRFPIGGEPSTVQDRLAGPGPCTLWQCHVAHDGNDACHARGTSREERDRRLFVGMPCLPLFYFVSFLCCAHCLDYFVPP